MNTIISTIGRLHTAQRLGRVSTLPFVVAVWLATCPCYSQDDSFQGASAPTTDAAVYGQGVRETLWQSPKDEAAGFHLPPGFQIQLFASEPLIDKPLNMNWGPKGRLWVTSTVEYPYPAKDPDAARDRVVILEDVDGDGRADTAKTFAEGLNIAMGILPMHDGAIVFSIPNIWYLKDTDGDDRCDSRQLLYGPFDTTRDTHGMINSLRSGLDGWIYACHGFNNQSEVAGSDGGRVRLHSGNTFRFRPDGSRIEHFTRGQVNPFGLTRDQWGNWYSADCHSKPLTALLPGACYPSFGRPHDGLGFAPEMMEHLHASTAISGLTLYRSAAFPTAYQSVFFSGNVMTSRINCNRLHWRGARATARELPDFMTSDDPWFRPVDLQIGLDGGLYVADFYNKIIGHYEVPLEHPGRDRKSGRIWRITHSAAPSTPVANASDWKSGFQSTNQTRRNIAVQNAAAQVAAGQNRAIQSGAIGDEILRHLRDSSRPVTERIACLQALVMCERISIELIAEFVREEEPTLAVQAINSGLAMRVGRSEPFTQSVRLAAKANDPHVRKAALECLGIIGDADDCLVTLDHAQHANDATTRHVALIASRNLLRDATILESISARILTLGSLTESYVAALRGLETAQGAQRLLSYAVENLDANQSTSAARNLLSSALDLAIQRCPQIPMERICAAIDLLDEPLPQRVARLADCVEQLRGGTTADESWPSQNAQMVAAERFRRSLENDLIAATTAVIDFGAPVHWSSFSEGTSASVPPGKKWPQQLRNLPNGVTTRLVSSHPLGEQYTGTLRSDPFPCPSSLSFRIAGHNGFPDEADHQKNYLRLIDANSGQEIRRVYPPRNDIATGVSWDLAATTNRSVRIEVIDGDAAGAYAWLAIGEFSLLELNELPVSTALDALADCIAIRTDKPHSGDAMRVVELRKLGSKLSPRSNTRLLRSYLEGGGHDHLVHLAEAAIACNRFDIMPWGIAQSNPSPDSIALLATELCASLPATGQRRLADGLVQTNLGCELLAAMLDANAMPADCLRGAPNVLPAGIAASVAKQLEKAIRAAKSTDENDLMKIAKQTHLLAQSETDLAVGQAMYTKHCATCHQLAGKGQVIGPQLDGATSRSFARLAEDILSPNRNVDRAFRTSSLLLDDDSVVTGLVITSENGSITVTLNDGKQLSIAPDSIVQRKDSLSSLMPNNLPEQMTRKQLASIIRYIKSQHQRAP